MTLDDTVFSPVVVLEGSECIRENSPWFNGHFPGDPIFPGIAQLQMVCDLIADALQVPLQLVRLSRVKFKKIVRPGEVLDIKVTPGNKENLYSFTLLSEGRDVCSGMMTLHPQ